jgi:hypothetical protein
VLLPWLSYMSPFLLQTVQYTPLLSHLPQVSLSVLPVLPHLVLRLPLPLIPSTSFSMADKYDEKSSVQEYETHNEPVGGVKEVTAASVALAAAVVARKPSSLLSPGMLKLYFILSVGYLISTMNGFDSSLMVGWYRSSFLERGH